MYHEIESGNSGLDLPETDDGVVNSSETGTGGGRRVRVAVVFFRVGVVISNQIRHIGNSQVELPAEAPSAGNMVQNGNNAEGILLGDDNFSNMRLLVIKVSDVGLGEISKDRLPIFGPQKHVPWPAVGHEHTRAFDIFRRIVAPPLGLDRRAAFHKMREWRARDSFDENSVDPQEQAVLVLFFNRVLDILDVLVLGLVLHRTMYPVLDLFVGTGA